MLGDNTSPSQNSNVHYQTQKKTLKKILASSCRTLLNSCSSLSKICANLPHSLEMVGTVVKSKNSLSKMFGNNMQQQVCKYHVTSMKPPQFLIG